MTLCPVAEQGICAVTGGGVERGASVEPSNHDVRNQREGHVAACNALVTSGPPYSAV